MPRFAQAFLCSVLRARCVGMVLASCDAASSRSLHHTAESATQGLSAALALCDMWGTDAWCAKYSKVSIPCARLRVSVQSDEEAQAEMRRLESGRDTRSRAAGHGGRRHQDLDSADDSDLAGYGYASH